MVLLEVQADHHRDPNLSLQKGRKRRVHPGKGPIELTKWDLLALAIDQQFVSIDTYQFLKAIFTPFPSYPANELPLLNIFLPVHIFSPAYRSA